MTTLFIIKPGFENYKKSIQRVFLQHGILWTEIGSFIFTRQLLEELYLNYTQEQWFKKSLVPALSGKTGILVRLDTTPNEKADIFGWVRDILGKADPENADKDSIRYRFGRNILENVGHTSANKKAFLREVDILDYHIPKLQVRKAFDVIMDT